MYKILVPFDGSENAMRAVHHAAEVAKNRSQCEVHLLHIAEPLNMTTNPDYWRAEVQKEHMEKGEQTAARARKVLDEAGCVSRTTVRMGYPHNDIAIYARDNGCDEIIMGSRGMSPAKSFFVGSVATRVLQHVNCPVTLVK